MGGDYDLLSIYLSPRGEDEVPLYGIHGLLPLVCCSKHVAEYKGSVGGLLIGTDNDNSNYPAGSPVPMYRFGSQDHADADYSFSFSVSDHASEPPSVDDSNVSSTRRLEVYSGGWKKVYKVDPEADSPAPSLAVSSPVDPDKAEFDTPTRGHSRLESGNAGNPSTPPARPSLSPDQARRANANRSEARARTPSPGHRGPRSDYGRNAWESMRGDMSYEKPPACNQKTVLELIRKPLEYNDERTWGKTGSVYVVRDPELELVKIGYTTNSVNKRVGKIASQCRASSKEWQIIHDASNTPIRAYRRLEELVHRDLAPHRWFFLCKCGSTKVVPNRVTEHQEWFDVSPEVAIKTIKL